MAGIRSIKLRGGLALGGLTMAGLGAVAGLGMLRRFDQWAIDTLSRPRRTDFRRDPADFDLPYEDVEFPSDDGIALRGWLIRASADPTAATATIIMGHGYTGNKDANLHYAAFMQQAGYNLLMFDFRAHGSSEGEQTSVGFIEHQDVHGAIRYLQGRGLGRIGYIGWSLGAAVGVVSAALYPEIRGLVADSSFSRLGSPIGVVLKNRFNRPDWMANMAGAYGERLLARDMGFDWREAHPAALVARISPRPILIIHSADDELIPVADAYTLYAAAREPKELWVEHEAQHVDGLYASYPEEYRRRVLEFWAKIDWET